MSWHTFRGLNHPHFSSRCVQEGLMCNTVAQRCTCTRAQHIIETNGRPLQLHLPSYYLFFFSSVIVIDLHLKISNYRASPFQWRLHFCCFCFFVAFQQCGHNIFMLTLFRGNIFLLCLIYCSTLFQADLLPHCIMFLVFSCQVFCVLSYYTVCHVMLFGSYKIKRTSAVYLWRLLYAQAQIYSS